MPSPSLALLRTQSDERLVALAQAGHEQAFEAIVRRYRRPLVQHGRRVLGDSQAEDAVQQALLAAWRGLRRGDDVHALQPWLHTIVHNASLNLLRANGKHDTELTGSLSTADEPHDELERELTVRRTLADVAALPERQRTALVGVAMEGRSQDEMARALGLSQGAFRQLVHRARTTLRAAATAFTPMPAATWLAAAGTRSEPITARVAELVAGTGSAAVGATLAKAGVVAVTAGGAVAGPALVDDGSESVPVTSGSGPARAAVSPSAKARLGGWNTLAAVGGDRSGNGEPASGDGGARPGSGESESSRRGSSGRDSGSNGPGSGSSGSGSEGSDSGSDSSGPGSGGSGSGSDSSGPGSGEGGSGSGGGGSGSGSSGSGSGESGSGSTGGSGSGSSGSSSGSDSSGSSGSGSSGPGSAGSGAGGSEALSSGPSSPTLDSGQSGSDSGSTDAGALDSSGSGSSGSGSSGSG
jgi:RNA polymerase sigma factor (sigma-70 family)